EYYLLVGTYTGSGSKGIYVYNFDAKTGAVKWVGNTDDASNPSFLAVSWDGRKVYAVNETGGANPAKVSAYNFDKGSGKLTFLNSSFTGGDGPCYVSISPANNWLAVANYDGGSATMLPLNEDGTIRPYAQLINDSIYKTTDKKETPHVHACVFSPDGNFLFTPDLGLDKVMIYHFNPASEKPLVLATPSFAASKLGGGPRHMTFHPNNKFAFVTQEMGGVVNSYRYQDGKLSKLQDIPTFPKGFTGVKDGAEIVVSPDGKFLYVSNRGDLNSITIFSINPTSGKLSLIGYQSTLGKDPRNFMIDPTGNYLLAANLKSNNVVVFKINKQTGLLTETNNQFDVPSPACLVMIRKN
ncbi:MAG: lactonase family protein, partial [Ginsengibacter sp.]